MKTKLPATIDEYIATFPKEVQTRLQQIRAAIQKAAPDATEAISYAMPTFKLKGNLVHFAGYKNHIGFYPAPAGITAFSKELEPYKWAKGSVQFPLDKPLPLSLVTKIVKYRVKNSLEKAAAKPKKVKPATAPFAFLAAPAQRALKNSNISTLKQLSSHPEKEIAALHGIGGNALAALKKALKQQGMSMK